MLAAETITSARPSFTAEALGDQKADHLPGPARTRANALAEIRRSRCGCSDLDRRARSQLEPEFAGNYAIRGIVQDHLGRSERAIADYRAALARDPSLTEGPGWLERLLYNIQEPPPTIADRLRYLETQMRLPPDQRVLRRPELDAEQRPHER